MNDLTEFFGEPIHVYTMAQAIEDGVLIDASDLAKNWFRWPVVLTSAAWADTVQWSEADSHRTGSWGQTESGRLRDVLWMSALAVRRAPKDSGLGASVKVTLARVPRDPERLEELRTREMESEDVELKATFAAADNGGPAIVISLPDED